MRRIISICLAIMMVVGMTGCSGSGETNKKDTESIVDTTVETAGKEGGTIGLLLPTVEAEVFVKIKEGVESGLSPLGYTVTTASFDFDSNKAIECIENFVISEVDCIVAMVFDNATDSTLKAAMDAGIKVVVVGTETAYYDHCIVADNVEIGTQVAEMAAEWVDENLDGKAQIAVITGIGNQNSAERSQGITDALAELLPDSEVVVSMDVGAETGDGTDFAENLLLQYPDVNVVCSINDARGIEVAEVFKAAGKTGADVGIFGCDCETQALTMILNGDIYSGSVDTGDYVQYIVGNVPRLLSGDDTLETKFICQGTKVTKENVSDYLK